MSGWRLTPGHVLKNRETRHELLSLISALRTYVEWVLSYLKRSWPFAVPLVAATGKHFSQSSGRAAGQPKKNLRRRVDFLWKWNATKQMPQTTSTRRSRWTRTTAIVYKFSRREESQSAIKETDPLSGGTAEITRPQKLGDNSLSFFF